MPLPTALRGYAASVQLSSDLLVARTVISPALYPSQNPLFLRVRLEQTVDDRKSERGRAVRSTLASQQAQRLRCPLPDQRAFEFRENGSQLSHRSSLRRTQIHAVLDAYQADRTASKAPKPSQRFGGITPETIKTHDHQRVDTGSTCVEKRRYLLSTGPIDK